MTLKNVVNFGCRLNLYESQIIDQIISDRKDIIVVNSCSVTAEAERQVKQKIRQLKRKNPDKQVVVTGCAVNINRAAYEEIADAIVDNREKLTHWESAKDPKQIILKEFNGYVRAFIQIQKGCDHRCTFCIIPYGRGNSTCLSPSFIISQIKVAASQGVFEVVLTGTDLVSYDYNDLYLGDLVKLILNQVPDVQIKISSLDPVGIDRTILDLLKFEPRVAPYLHISVQAGNDLILKRMKRRHSRQDVIDLSYELRKARPEFIIGADIIAGFPTETDDMFEDSFKLIEQAQLSLLHVFPYSEREGTPAALIPNQVPVPIRNLRAKKLIEQGRAVKKRVLKKFIGSYIGVIFEKTNVGKSVNFLDVIVKDDKYHRGSFARLQVIGIENDRLVCN